MADEQSQREQVALHDPPPHVRTPHRWPSYLAAFRATFALLWTAQGAEPDVALLRNAGLAVNQPDEFAWRLFVEICQPVTPDGRVVIWETWANQEQIYANPNEAPVWPTSTAPVKQLRAPRQQAVRAATFGFPPLPDDRVPGGNEEVHDNRPAFDYIVKNGLWYQQGVLRQAAQPGGIHFPQEAVTVKARWRYLTEAQKPKYHWAEYQKGGTNVLVGLIALHVTSKVIPNWHWATFEHVDNPGLADYMGVVDTFGLVPARLYPNPTPNQGCDGGKLKDQVVQLMKQKQLGAEWTNYRLKGPQVDFTDSTGRDALLGNSITEEGFVASGGATACRSLGS